MEDKVVLEPSKPKKTTKQKTFFILRIIGNVIFYMIIIALFIFAIANIRSGGKGGIPNIFGTGYLAVESDSMDRFTNEANTDPLAKLGDDYKKQYQSYAIQSFTKKDMVVVNMLDDNAKKTSLRVGDVVVYKNSTLQGMTANTNVAHRIVYVYFSDGTGTTSNNEELYKGKEISYVTTQGDLAVTKNLISMNYTAEEAICQGVQWEVNSDKNGTKAITQWENVQLTQIQAKVTGVWYGFGQAIRDMQANFFWIFVLPVLIVLVIEIFFVIKNILDYRAEKKKANGDVAAQTFDVEAEKARIKAELMAELAAQQAAQNNTADENKEETSQEDNTETEENVLNTNEDTKVEAENKTEDNNVDENEEEVKTNDEVNTEEKVEENNDESNEEVDKKDSSTDEE